MSIARFSRRLSLVLLSLGMAAAGAVLLPTSAAAQDGATEELIWRGDIVFARGIMNELATHYTRQYKGKLVLQPFSTVSGLDAVAQGTADLGGSARGRHEARPEEDGLNFIPMALDAITPIVHPRNPARNIALTQLRDVYLGKITNWRDLGGIDAPINLYGIAAPLDGVEFSARALLFGNGDQRVAAPRLYVNTAKLEEAVAIDPAGLGFSTLSSTFANKGVKALNVQFVAATVDNVANGSYPLFNVLYLAVGAQPAKAEAIDHFLSVVQSDAVKAMMRKHQLVPYADADDHADLHSQRAAFLALHLPRPHPVRTVAAAAVAAQADEAAADGEALPAQPEVADSATEKRRWFKRAPVAAPNGGAAPPSPAPEVAAGTDG